MRIIAGKYKFKKLHDFNVSSTRPTSDRTREALFSILQKNVPNAVCLDLFAGTGALGLEALSRGANFCYFVEHNIDIYKIMVKNFQECNADKNSLKALRSDYLKALKGYKNKNIKFDIIFIDPPYKTDFAETSINFILDNNLLNENGIIVWEHDETKLDKLKNYNILTHKEYGKTYVSILNNYA